jgi:transcriptional regulator with XRE-family HTH domain
MKSPFTGNEVILIKEKKNLIFRKDEFTYTHHSYLCEDSKESFTDTELDTLNLTQVYNQYLDKYNLPFPEEIISIRKKYNLPANKMGLSLGFGVNTYRNYENGEVPSLANAKLIQLAKNPKSFKLLVEESQGVFSDIERTELLEHIDSIIQQERKNHFNIDLQNYIFGDSNPDIYTGYKPPSLEKLTEMIVYFTRELNPLKTVMNKLLFYADFLNFKKTSFSISGTRYVAIDYGPVPNNFQTIFEKLQKENNFKINTIDYGNGYYGEEFKPIENRVFNPDYFRESEVDTLEEIVKKFSGVSRNEIVRMSHEEEAWIKNFEDGKKLIKYHYSFDLKHV